MLLNNLDLDHQNGNRLNDHINYGDNDNIDGNKDNNEDDFIWYYILLYGIIYNLYGNKEKAIMIIVMNEIYKRKYARNIKKNFFLCLMLSISP